MKTIIIDNDETSREMLLFFVGMIRVLNLVGVFDNPNEAIEYVKYNPTDLAIFNIKMPGIDRAELERRLRESDPKLSLVGMTAEKICEISRLHFGEAALTKTPFCEEVFDAVKSDKQLAKQSQKHIFARTFGYFDLFVDGKPVMFKSAKAKELLAFLIDRQGGTVTTDQIITVLWEDRPNDEATQNLCSKVVKTLKKELDEYEVGNILIQKRGVRSIDTAQVNCDMYELMKGSAEAKEQFFGDYMLEYSWAEGRTESLRKRAESIPDKKN